jgi:hypothetical protein
MEHYKQEMEERVYFQPALFSDRSEISALRDDQSSLLAKLNNLRRGVFKRLDDLFKLCKEIMFRQDERDLEMARMQNRLNLIESELLNRGNTRTSRNIDIVGRKKATTRFYMMGK